MISIIESLLGGEPKVILTLELFALGVSWYHFLTEGSELSSLLKGFAYSHEEEWRHIAIVLPVLPLCFPGEFSCRKMCGINTEARPDCSLIGRHRY